jgi:hypothetical protein
MSRAFQRIWLESSPGTYFFPGHEYAEALLPSFFKDTGSQTLPNHPDDYKTVTDQFWLTRRRRRFFRPPMPTIPVTVEVEMAYNPYFNSLHSAADVLAAILRRQCMKYSAEMQVRAKSRVSASTLASRHRHHHHQSQHSTIPCPPNVDKEYWETLPREMQEDMLSTLKHELDAMTIGEGTFSVYEEEDGASLDSGFHGQASTLMATITTSGGGVQVDEEDFVLGGGEDRVDLIGGAPSASLDDTNEDYFARLSTSESVVMQQFDFAGAYNYEVTLEQLITALNVLSAGGDRVEVKTIYRALTTLGSREGTGMCTTRAKRGDEGWRGMNDDEAKLLIDSFNYPQQVLMTGFEDMKNSSESLVVEYAATLFSQVCDRTVVPPPKGFLALCRRCKICPESKRPKQGQQIRGESLSLERDSTSSSSGENSGNKSPSQSLSKVAPSSIAEETEQEEKERNDSEGITEAEAESEDLVSKAPVVEGEEKQVEMQEIRSD